MPGFEWGSPSGMGLITHAKVTMTCEGSHHDSRLKDTQDTFYKGCYDPNIVTPHGDSLVGIQVCLFGADSCD